jgi:CHAD domain-containing protein
MPRKTLHLVADEGFELPRLAGRALPRRTYTETYYDTAGGRLSRSGFLLRRRVENGKGIWRLTVASDGIATVDVEAPGGPAEPPEEMRELITAAAAGFSVAPVARVSTQTGGFRVKAGSSSLARIDVATVAVLEGRRTIRAFCEIDVEQLAADRKELSRIEKILRGAGAKRTNGAGLLERTVGRDEEPELPAPTRELERLRAFCRYQYARMLAHDPGVRLGSDPEDLHQLRVASRRLRSILRTAEPVLDREWVSQLRDELSWLGQELGEARDLDVLSEHLDAEAARLDQGDRKALKPFFEKLAEARVAARERALEALRSERYFGLLAAIEAAAAGLPPGGRGSLASAARKEFGRLRKAMKKVEESPGDETIHRARIKGKRARYAIELVEDELGSSAKGLVTAAKRFQDVAGEHQDAVVAEARIRAFARAARSLPAALAAGLLVGRQQERRRAASAQLPKAWAKLEQAASRVWS